MSALIQTVPEGFKQTDVGIIPEDWSVKAFAQVMSIRHGKDQKAVQVIDGQYPIFGTGGKMGTTNTALYDKPSVLIGRKGTINKPRFIDIPFWTVDTLFYSEVSKKESAKFIYYKFCMIDWMQYNEASGVPSLNSSTIENILASFPVFEEQTSIANALSDVDALLTELEKLTAKKQAIKTATMQQLLTGKTRLPHFAYYTEGEKQGQPKGTKPSELGEIPEDWEVLPFNKMFSYQNGKAQEHHFNSHDGYQVISIGNYSESGQYIDTGSYIDKKLKKEIGRFVLKQGELAMILNDKTAIGTIIGRVILIDKDDTYVMNQRTMRLSPFDGMNSQYLYALINSDFVHKRIVGMAKPGTQIYINTDDVLDFQVSLPTSEEEQVAIANIHFDMDNEIQTLEQRLKKTRQIKQGMMQELLTGRTRLPICTEAE